MGLAEHVMAVGHYASIQGAARHWLAALDMAVNREFPHGARAQGFSLMSDHGCQPTAVAFMQACRPLGIQQAFTSFNNPQGNADTERFMRTLKEECLWLQEWTSPFGLISALDNWVETYNDHYLHSALGYKSPRQFKRKAPTAPQHSVRGRLTSGERYSAISPGLQECLIPLDRDERSAAISWLAQNVFHTEAAASELRR